MRLNDWMVFECEKDGNPICRVVGEMGPLITVEFDGMDGVGAVPVFPSALVPLEKWNTDHPEDKKQKPSVGGE